MQSESACKGGKGPGHGRDEKGKLHHLVIICSLPSWHPSSTCFCRPHTMSLESSLGVMDMMESTPMSGSFQQTTPPGGLSPAPHSRPCPCADSDASDFKWAVKIAM
jgi:hypothetical protein